MNRGGQRECYRLGRFDCCYPDKAALAWQVFAGQLRADDFSVMPARAGPGGLLAGGAGTLGGQRLPRRARVPARPELPVMDGERDPVMLI
jgi:hypothetical protein